MVIKQFLCTISESSYFPNYNKQLLPQKMRDHPQKAYLNVSLFPDVRFPGLRIGSLASFNLAKNSSSSSPQPQYLLLKPSTKRKSSLWIRKF